MPLVESADQGLSPGPLPFPASASSRKEKKKQAKEERDRLKQAEKKKRRLEKALATAAAIRSELEQKKQRRKEEERLLDEEGAALAEAVALQVLVDEEPDGLRQMWAASDGHSQNGRDGEGGSSFTERIGDEAETREPLQHNRLKHHGTFKCSPSSDGNEREMKGLNMSWSEWDAHAEDQQVGVRDVIGLEGELLQGEQDSMWEFCNCAEESGRASNKRAHTTEVAVGMAAAQAVAALQIAEEAQAQAQAAQKAAEEAMNEALDHHDPHKRPEYLYETTVTAQCVEKERDELKGQLQETERKLHEQTCRVVELERNLEEVVIN
jgi:hypothetical protein